MLEMWKRLYVQPNHNGFVTCWARHDFGHRATLHSRITFVFLAYVELCGLVFIKGLHFHISEAIRSNSEGFITWLEVALLYKHISQAPMNAFRCEARGCDWSM